MHWKTTRVVPVLEVGSSSISASQMMIVVNAEEEEEAEDIVTSMDTHCTRYKMEIGQDKTK